MVVAQVHSWFRESLGPSRAPQKLLEGPHGYLEGSRAVRTGSSAVQWERWAAKVGWAGCKRGCCWSTCHSPAWCLQRGDADSPPFPLTPLKLQGDIRVQEAWERPVI